VSATLSRKAHIFGCHLGRWCRDLKLSLRSLASSAKVYDKFSPGSRPTGASAIITDLLSRFCVRCTILAGKLTPVGEKIESRLRQHRSSFSYARQRGSERSHAWLS
jgi:hypothetical protein